MLGWTGRSRRPGGLCRCSVHRHGRFGRSGRRGHGRRPACGRRSRLCRSGRHGTDMGRRRGSLFFCRNRHRCRSCRLSSLRCGHRRIANRHLATQAINGFRADARDIRQVIDAAERPVLPAVIHDGLGPARPDPFQSVKFCQGGGIEIDPGKRQPGPQQARHQQCKETRHAFLPKGSGRPVTRRSGRANEQEQVGHAAGRITETEVSRPERRVAAEIQRRRIKDATAAGLGKAFAGFGCFQR